MYDFLTSIEVYNFLKGPMVWLAFMSLSAEASSGSFH